MESVAPGFRVCSLEYRVWGVGERVAPGFRVCSLEYRVWGVGERVGAVAPGFSVGCRGVEGGA